MPRLDKKLSVSVTVHKGGNFLGNSFDSFDSIEVNFQVNL